MGSKVIGATVPTAFIDYRLNFVRPILGKWNQNGEIIQAILDALRPWNVRLGSVSAKSVPANLGEIQVSFEIVPQRIVFNLFLEAASLFVANIGWGDAPNFRRLVEAIRPALAKSASVEIANIQATLAFHVTPNEGKSVREITEKFAPAGETADESVTAFGFSIYRGDSSKVVDLSLLYANSLFVRLIRNFDQSRSLDEIESTLRSDQASVLNQLGLKID
jgi:hypothetical protein